MSLIPQYEKSRREKLAGFLYDLAKMMFASLVIGLFIKDNFELSEKWPTLVLGLAATVILASIANKVLKPL